ncbi:hypothetical protein DOTSEDRAFT_34289 [Dothistroma septosporum NZE10]|uniref:Uncharacterized protein n=1 Tax=Dothistroma septosporum (strain NZE10 / CBS 128990) TaxID=675120 RepID=N1PSF4_DOTSN|nr:hypothetical protein DOTSEDRAFT_34289 [Dothistroma septosporum NZE10]
MRTFPTLTTTALCIPKQETFDFSRLPREIRNQISHLTYQDTGTELTPHGLYGWLRTHRNITLPNPRSATADEYNDLERGVARAVDSSFGIAMTGKEGRDVVLSKMARTVLVYDSSATSILPGGLRTGMASNSEHPFANEMPRTPKLVARSVGEVVVRLSQKLPLDLLAGFAMVKDLRGIQNPQDHAYAERKLVYSVYETCKTGKMPWPANMTHWEWYYAPTRVEWDDVAAMWWSEEVQHEEESVSGADLNPDAKWRSTVGLLDVFLYR